MRPRSPWKHSHRRYASCLSRSLAPGEANGESWWIASAGVSVSSRNEAPARGYYLSSETFAALSQGRLDGAEAIFAGRVLVEHHGFAEETLLSLLRDLAAGGISMPAPRGVLEPVGGAA